MHRSRTLLRLTLLPPLLLLAAHLPAASASAAPVAIANAGFEAPYLAGNLPPQYAGDVPPGAFPTGAPPDGWLPYSESGSPGAGEFLGVLNPGTAADYVGAPPGIDPCFPGGAPEGDNVALLFTSGATGGQEYGIRQELGATLQPSTTYTLQVEVGNIQTCGGLVPPYQSQFVLDGFPSYRVQLLAGGVLLEEDAGQLTPGEGLFETTTVVLTTGELPALQDQPLEIRLINRNEDLNPAVGNREVDFDDVQLDASPAAFALPALGSRWMLLVAAMIAGPAGLARLREARARR